MDISGLFYFSFYYGETLACLCKEVEYVWVAWSFYTSAFFFFIYLFSCSVTNIQQSSQPFGKFISGFSNDKAMNMAIWFIVPIIGTFLLTSLIISTEIFCASKEYKFLCLFNVRENIYI